MLLLVMLGAAWGSSYLFIKVAVDDISPATMTAARLLLAAVVLGAVVVSRKGVRRVRDDLLRARRASLLLGVVNLALPTWLVAWGEQHIDSGTAAIAQASVPVFVVLLAVRLLPEERATAGRLVGIGIGVAGVALLVGGQSAQRSVAVLGVGAVIASSLSYAAAAIYIRSRTPALDGPTLVVGELIVGGVILLPFATLQLPDHLPARDSLAAIVALAVIGTVAAQLMLFRLLRIIGPGRASVVTYLIPAFALGYGWVLLDERVSAVSLAGLACILAGVAVAARSDRRTADVLSSG